MKERERWRGEERRVGWGGDVKERMHSSYPDRGGGRD